MYQPAHFREDRLDVQHRLIKGIVGLEIAIARIEGKWKVNQNRPAIDRAGVVAGLRGEGGDAALIASAVLERSKKVQ
jgi:transcriptional regulator